MGVPLRRLLAAGAALGVMGALPGCGGGGDDAGGPAEKVAAESPGKTGSPSASESASPSASASPSGSPSASASASASSSASPSERGSSAAGNGGDDAAEESGSSGGAQSGSGGGTDPAPAAPSFPVPVSEGNATQLITVDSRGSYATVTAWAKGSSGWKKAFSTSSGRVGSNGVTPGSTRQQGTWTTPSGTYTITEGFGVESSGTAMPYTVVNDSHWWVQDPESDFYNQMHTEEGADFPLTESGDRGSEHLVNYPHRYANALVIDFNRWPAVPGRGAGIFLHINGSGATAGCVSVPRATMERIMTWIKPGAHPRIAIG